MESTSFVEKETLGVLSSFFGSTQHKGFMQNCWRLGYQSTSPNSFLKQIKRKSGKKKILALMQNCLRLDLLPVHPSYNWFTVAGDESEIPPFFFMEISRKREKREVRHVESTSPLLRKNTWYPFISDADLHWHAPFLGLLFTRILVVVSQEKITETNPFFFFQTSQCSSWTFPCFLKLK